MLKSWNITLRNVGVLTQKKKPSTGLAKLIPGTLRKVFFCTDAETHKCYES